jgi:hypothetical protein
MCLPTLGNAQPYFTYRYYLHVTMLNAASWKCQENCHFCLDSEKQLLA